MKTRKEFVSILLSLKGELEARFHVKSIGIFGSVARNENTDTSDLVFSPIAFWSTKHENANPILIHLKTSSTQ